MLVRHFKNHSPTPPKYVRLKLPTFANGGGEQLVPLEIVGERAQLLATFARVERTPGELGQYLILDQVITNNY